MSQKQIDTRGFETNTINNTVINAFDSLPVGEKMVIINDTDPSHVFKHLEEKRMGKFEWEYIEEGPDVWKVSLAKKYLSYI